MAIKILFILILTTTLLSAQSGEDRKRVGFKGKTYEMSWIKSSPNQKYISFQKTYEYSSDTLVLLSVDKPNHIVYQTAGVYPISIKYSPKGYLFMSGVANAQYLKLPDLKPTLWSGISKAIFLESYNRIAILQNDMLQIYNEEVELQEEIRDVTAVEYKEGRLFYTKKRGSRWILAEWSPQVTKNLYTAETSKIRVGFCEGAELIIYENNPASGNAVIHYLTTDGEKEAIWQNEAGYAIKRPAVVSKTSPNHFFVSLAVEQTREQKSSVDIWYGNDNNLGKKFQNNVVLKHFIWNTADNSVKELDASEFPKQMNVGNPNYLLALDPALHQDYTHERINYEIHRYDIANNTYDFLGKTGIYNYLDREGRFLLSYDNKDWVLYRIDTKEKTVIPAAAGSKPYFARNGLQILFTEPHLAVYDIKEKKLRPTTLRAGYESTAVNINKATIGIENMFYKNTYDEKEPLLIKITNPDTAEQGMGIYHKGRFRELYTPSIDFVNMATLMPDQKSCMYLKSNYNRPFELTLNKGGRESVIFNSNPQDKKSKEIRQETISFTNSKGVPLKGILFYPTTYDSHKKYPMIVGIYEMLRSQVNRYLRDGFSGRIEGMNIRHYLNRGYFVYLPDIVYDSRGPGRSALDCVESSLDALQTLSSIDFQKVGLMGHSHGGYQTNFIATQSTRFAAYLSGSANSDLVRSYHSFNYNFVSPFFWQFEEQQYRMFKSFAEDKQLYIDNSPIYHAEKVSGPILLWAGTKDENIVWDQSMEFYMGLRRNHKKVTALFYKGQGHDFQDKTNREDLYTRISEWFDFHLKKINSEWISILYH
ncbi:MULTISPECIES: S9 family peptidase [unclassified Kaistella]|uniref:alpha/beta hydrolase family protein n=1 Tax=unclassified Kaistella TaxID=2762626 RepID=UPI00273730C3|nr:MULTISPECIES: prolyl oligopeptidase family serine peptidase [unclassified Kaistella]MDP2452501.1 prolyl oligopeptidase family serine peptidase [Kaistella sp. SH11-4b]MDP2455409.1 prolyl oligopeptidase family serine peptidase [Kaistella sp. SH40-3]MDP2458313.1 prolyl oligopeptidase family serine peptidase [Kaistella sp. SH19-2b]